MSVVGALWAPHSFPSSHFLCHEVRVAQQPFPSLPAACLTLSIVGSLPCHFEWTLHLCDKLEAGVCVSCLSSPLSPLWVSKCASAKGRLEPLLTVDEQMDASHSVHPWEPVLRYQTSCSLLSDWPTVSSRCTQVQVTAEQTLSPQSGNQGQSSEKGPALWSYQQRSRRGQGGTGGSVSSGGVPCIRFAACSSEGRLPRVPGRARLEGASWY